MSQRCGKGAVDAATFADVQRRMREAGQQEKADLIQDTVSAAAAILQARGAELLPLALELCDPVSASSSSSASSTKVKKFGFLNAAWKLLLAIMTSPSIDSEAFQRGASVMVHHLRNGVLSHDWTDVKKNKLATFFASHVVTTVRAHPEYVLACPSLLDELTTLYTAVCVVLATSERDDASLRPLYDHIMTRLHAVLDSLGGAAPRAANDQADAAKSSGEPGTHAMCFAVLCACVSAPMLNAVKAEAGDAVAVDMATGLAAASAFLHVTVSVLRPLTTTAPGASLTTSDTAASRGASHGLFLSQLAELLLSWLPTTNLDQSGQGGLATATSPLVSSLRQRVREVARTLPPSTLTTQCDEPPCPAAHAPGKKDTAETADARACTSASASADGLDASSPKRLWQTAFALTLRALFRDPAAATIVSAHGPPREGRESKETKEADAATGGEESTGAAARHSSDECLERVLLRSLCACQSVEAVAAVFAGWSQFVVQESAEILRLACAGASLAKADEEQTAAHTASPWSDAESAHDRLCQLVCRLLCLAEGLLRVRARALREQASPTEPSAAVDAVARWASQLSTQLCALTACGCMCRAIARPPSALLQAVFPDAAAMLTAGEEEGEETCLLPHAVHVADLAYEGMASTLESAVRAVPEELWAPVSSEPTCVSGWVFDLVGDGLGAEEVNAADAAWQQLEHAIQHTLQTFSTRPPRQESELLSSSLLSIPVRLRRYRMAVTQAGRHTKDTTLPLQPQLSSAVRARLHADIMSSADLWKSLTELLQRHVKGSPTSDSSHFYQLLSSTCRYVATLLLREFAFLPVTPGATDGPETASNGAPGRVRSAEVLMACIRRWLQLAMLEKPVHPNVDEEDSVGVGGAGDGAVVDGVALEAAHSLLCFAEHNTDVSLHDLRLSGHASAALMQLLDKGDDEKGGPEAPCSSRRRSPQITDAESLNAWLMPTPTRLAQQTLSDETLVGGLRLVTTRACDSDQQRHGHGAVSDEESGASRDATKPQPRADADLRRVSPATSPAPPTSTYDSRFDALMTELQTCRQTISTFLSIRTNELPRQPSVAKQQSSVSERARSPLPSHRSFGDTLPHHLRGRRGGGGGRPGEGRSPSCSQTPPAELPRSHSPPPTRDITCAGEAVPELTDLSAQLRSLVALSTQALQALEPSHTAGGAAAVEGVNTVASVVGLDGAEWPAGRAPVEGSAGTQPPGPASPWDSHATQRPRVKEEQGDLLAGPRTRTVPIMTLSSRSTPQRGDDDVENEIIDVDL